MLIRCRNHLHVVALHSVRRKDFFHIMKIVARTFSGGRANHDACLPPVPRLAAAPSPRCRTSPPRPACLGAPASNEDGRRCPNTDGGIPHAPHKFSLFSALFAQHLSRRLSVAAAWRGTDRPAAGWVPQTAVFWPAATFVNLGEKFSESSSLTFIPFYN